MRKILLVLSILLTGLYFYVFFGISTFILIAIFNFSKYISWGIGSLITAFIYLIIPETCAMLLYKRTRFKTEGIIIASINVLLSVLILLMVNAMSGI